MSQCTAAGGAASCLEQLECTHWHVLLYVIVRKPSGLVTEERTDPPDERAIQEGGSDRLNPGLEAGLATG